MQTKCFRLKSSLRGYSANCIESRNCSHPHGSFCDEFGWQTSRFHSVGQNKVYAEKQTGAIKKQMRRHLKKVSKTNTYNILQQLTGRAPQQQLLVLGMTMVSCWKKNHREIIYIFQFFNYSRFCLKIRLNYSCFFSWSLVFKCMVLKSMFTFYFFRQKPACCSRKIYLMNL